MNSLLRRARASLQAYGAAATFRKVHGYLARAAKLLPYRLLEAMTAARAIKQLKDFCGGQCVYVLIANIDWHIPLFQRPHQMARALSAREKSVVLFVSDQYRHDRFAWKKRVTDTLFLYSIRKVSRLNTVLSEAKRVVVLMSWQRHYALLAQFKFDRLIYEYIDDLSVLYYSDSSADSIHRRLMETADLTVATAQKLYQKALPVAKNLLLSENAGDYDFFSAHKTDAVNEQLATKAQEYSATLGYYGSLASWFDYRTIAQIAKNKNDWLIVLVGFDFDGTLSKSGLNQYDNILLFPAQPYEKLPSFLNGFDIALIPFLLNEITAATSPVKLFEYMAAGKPILASDLPECRKYESVFRYRNAEECIAFAERLLRLPPDDAYFAALEKEARANTWRARTEQILSAGGECAA